MASNTSMRREDKNLGKNIQVVVRCRPFSAGERKATHNVIDCDANRKEVAVRTGGVNDKAAAARKTYTFDMVFGPAAKQIDVYRSVVCPILDEVIMGYNCTVFAYGQTGTGKTFTMEGERSPDLQVTWEDDPLAGIIPRTLHQIFEKLAESGSEFSVRVSLLEIYNEELFDLLSPGEDVGEKLNLFDDPRNKRGVVVKGLEEITVHNKDEVYAILERGSAKRKTAATLMNAYSSRSHSVFSITIHMKEITVEGEELVKIGKLNLVDLAGSENIGRSGAQDKRAREAGNINQSLLTLGRVITALVEKRPHVPYRESKLTRILQDSLGGRTKTSIIATVSPSSCNMEETLSTLEYANRAKNIMNKPEINQKMTKKTLIKEYTEDIERLKRDLAAARDKNGVYLSSENYSHMTAQLTAQEETIAGYMERIAAAEEELKKVTELFTDTQSQLEQCTVQLEEKDHRLEETKKALEETAQHLTEEQFVCSDLTNTQENLYSTADQLLNTAHVSTSHVSDLHDKLDRKNEVEQQNLGVRQSFSQRMDGVLGNMEGSVRQQASKHRSTLASLTSSMDSVLSVNEEAMRGAVATMESFMGGVTHLVAQGLSGFQDKLNQQEALCLENSDSLLELQEEFKQDLQEALAASLLPSVSAIRTLNEAMRKTVEDQRALADKVEAMKEVNVFLTNHVQELAELRMSSLDALSSLDAEHANLTQKFHQSSETQQTEMDQMIQCLQSQLSLLAINNKSRFDDLNAATRALQRPVQALRETISTRCSAAEKRVAVQADHLSATVPSLASAIRHTAQEADQTLEESTGYCTLLHDSLTGLGDRNISHCSRVQERVQNQAQEHVSLLGQNSAATQALQQSVESHSKALLPDTRAQLTGQQEKVSQAVRSLQTQVSLDQAVLDQEQAALQSHVESAQELVHNFHQELRQDVPTGMTPQRREFVFPRELVKSRRRSELLGSLRLQQEELQAAMELQATATTADALETEPELEAEHRVEQDVPEDEAASESFVDENLVCNENSRGPFFKTSQQRKKRRVPKTEVPKTPSEAKSKLPLRSQN